ncbi:MAG: hypothetical protein IH950_05585 [Bacteroidetes bacterium]|nr:hypothetical protein [Bacteroidota bacterium]
MQTLEVIKAINWIDSQISEETKKTIFSIESIRKVKDEREMIRFLITGFLELIKLNELLTSNENAMIVLKSFDLEEITEIAFLQNNILDFSMPEQEPKGHKVEQMRFRFQNRWFRMIESSKIWQKLTTPIELLDTTKHKDLITLNIKQSKDDATSIELIIEVLDLFEKTYLSIADIYKIDKAGKLTLVKIESGSGIRIDLRGIGEAVKYLKEFILESWHKIRHKRVEEVIENNKAILTSIKTIQYIDESEKNDSLTHEEAERFKHNIIKSTLGLFEHGAVIAEIPDQEVVDNTKLLESFSPKLLTEAKVVKKPKKAISRRKTKKDKTKK